jgi:hypothetical protein
MSGPSRAAGVALLAFGVLIFTAAVHPAAAKDGIAARKMLYPQREWSEWQMYPVRTVQQIRPIPKAVALDRFGGRRDQNYAASGFYYARKIRDRWWLIDPDGHPFLNAGVGAVAPAHSPASSKAFAKTFRTPDEWMRKTRELLLANGFNGAGAWSDVRLLRASSARSAQSLSYAINLDVMSAYGVKRGGTYDVPGHKAYPENTIFVFDPSFESFADQYVASRAGPYRDDHNLIGYFSDNELPFTRDNLDGYLRLPASDPGHQAAERWMQEHHATDLTDSLRSEFLEFEAYLYFRIVSSAIRKADPNHMYLGCRFHGQALNEPELFRAAGKYAGAVSVNVYGIWQLDSETTATWERESGKPFLVTEFYAKGEDSGMPNHTGAGWLVHTQDDRGLFYQNFVLALLASRACVGWQWFKYQDNDPDDPHAEASNRDSNKGIVDRSYKPYKPLLARMHDLNRKMYGISDAIDSADVRAITRDRQY